MEIKATRIVDAVEKKRIIAFIEGKGRIIVLEGEEYPKGGLVGMSKKSFAEKLTVAIEAHEAV